MSRFARVEIPPMSPAQCKICGTATRGPFLDLQYAEDFYGSVYYCFTCAEEMARILGFIHPDKYQSLIEENARLEHDIAEAGLALTKTKNVAELINGFVKYYDDTLLNTNIGPGHFNAKVPSGTDEIVDAGEGSVNESSNVSGLADLFSVTNNNTTKSNRRTRMVDI